MTTTPLEATRVIVAAMLAACAAWGFATSNFGQYALLRPMRERLQFRRRVQMGGFLIIAVLLGGQSLYLASVVDPTAVAMMTGSVAILLSLSVLLVLTMIHVYGWAYEESRVGRTALQPDSAECAQRALELASAIGHGSANAIALVTLPLEAMLADGSVPETHRLAVEQALTSTYTLVDHLTELHNEIRNLKTQLRTEAS